MPKYRVYEIEENKVMITGVYKTRAVLRTIRFISDRQLYDFTHLS
jgi:hypothetical protein